MSATSSTRRDILAISATAGVLSVLPAHFVLAADDNTIRSFKINVPEEQVVFAELRRIPYDQIVSWGYGDFVFGAGFDIISSMTKARRYGFHEAVDTEEMFFRMFDELRASKVIP
jgi:hypothetical protein